MTNNSVVLITGGLTGIGRAAAVAFAKKGAKVVVAGRRADVRKDDEVRALVDKTVARFGRLDVAVNNAGTEGRVGPITDQTAESYAATFDTNVLGVILSMKHEVRAMQGQGSGAIINISSTYGHEGAAGASVYVGSKHAVEQGSPGDDCSYGSPRPLGGACQRDCLRRLGRSVIHHRSGDQRRWR